MCMKSNDRITIIILGLLSQYPMSGYDLKQQMEISVSNFVRPSYGNIYPTLKKLEASQLIERLAETNARHKKVFKATAAGHNVLVKWLGSPLDDSEPFLLREYFFSFISVREQNQLIQAYLLRLEALHTRYQWIEKTYQTAMGPYPYQTLRYGLYNVQSDITWYTQLLQES